MSDRSTSLLRHQPHNNPAIADLERHRRLADELRGAENDALVRRIAMRIAASAADRPRERRLTKTYLQPLGFPVIMQGKVMLCAVRQTFIMTNPRERETITYWFATVELARERFPEAKLIELPKALPAVPPAPRLLMDQEPPRRPA
jgi:hypothetical protein